MGSTLAAAAPSRTELDDFQPHRNCASFRRTFRGGNAGEQSAVVRSDAVPTRGAALSGGCARRGSGSAEAGTITLPRTKRSAQPNPLARCNRRRWHRGTGAPVARLANRGGRVGVAMAELRAGGYRDSRDPHFSRASRATGLGRSCGSMLRRRDSFVARRILGHRGRRPCSSGLHVLGAGQSPDGLDRRHHSQRKHVLEGACGGDDKPRDRRRRRPAWSRRVIRDRRAVRRRVGVRGEHRALHFLRAAARRHARPDCVRKRALLRRAFRGARSG